MEFTKKEAKTLNLNLHLIDDMLSEKLQNLSECADNADTKSVISSSSFYNI